MSYKTIISAENLIKNINNKEFIIFDCRCDIKETSYGIDQYTEGHIPNAVFVDIDTDLADKKTSTSGRHPLPDPKILTEKLCNWGMSNTKQVVIYDDAGGAFASRMWWILRWLGHEKTALLNGGLGAYMAAGGKLTSEIKAHENALFDITIDDAMHVTLKEVEDAQYRMDKLIIDARSKERYLGIKDMVDPIAGHVPGAISYPLGNNLDKRGCFKSSEELKLQFSKILGDIKTEGIISMCGSGITACHNILAMEIAGIKNVRLYVGSWSEWITDKNRPIATIDKN
jgi:thiosulfate/3-mercaptopyruvate sulfurtransferase